MRSCENLDGLCCPGFEFIHFTSVMIFCDTLFIQNVSSKTEFCIMCSIMKIITLDRRNCLLTLDSGTGLATLSLDAPWENFVALKKNVETFWADNHNHQ